MRPTPGRNLATPIGELLATHAELAEVRDYTDQLHALMHRPGLAFQ